MHVRRDGLTTPKVFVQEAKGIDKGLQRGVEPKHWHLALSVHAEHISVASANRQPRPCSSAFGVVALAKSGEIRHLLYQTGHCPLALLADTSKNASRAVVG